MLAIGVRGDRGRKGGYASTVTDRSVLGFVSCLVERGVSERRACDSAAAMATRKMDALFPKRKSSGPSGAKSSKALSAASSKPRDPVFGVHRDVGSGAGSVGAADSQPAALVSAAGKDLNEDYDDVEEILRQFDMNMAYGPCLGITRLERFERSQRMGLNPPVHVKNILERVGGKPDSLWEGRV